MVLKEKDFIEIEFTGKLKDTGEIFDSNIKEDIDKSISDKERLNAKPFVFSLGQGMFLKGIDDFLVGKEEGKTYNLELEPENAFGKRNAKLITRMPSKIFKDHKINPVSGYTFNFDGRPGKILSVSGGRVIVDFNHPLSGKQIQYKIKVLRVINDLKEKIESFNDFLFRRTIDFEIKDKKLLMNVEKPLVKFVEMFKDKFKDILGLDLEVKEKQLKKE